MSVGSQVKQTLATLKSVQGTLHIYHAQTQDEESRNIYQQALDTTAQVIKDLEARVKELEMEEPQYKGN